MPGTSDRPRIVAGRDIGHDARGGFYGAAHGRRVTMRTSCAWWARAVAPTVPDAETAKDVAHVCTVRDAPESRPRRGVRRVVPGLDRAVPGPLQWGHTARPHDPAVAHRERPNRAWTWPRGSGIAAARHGAAGPTP